MQIEFPQLPDGLLLDTSKANYFEAFKSSYVDPPSKPLSVSEWIFGKGEGYQSALVIISNCIEDPSSDIIATNLRVRDNGVSVCKNLAFWDQKFWVIETANRWLRRPTQAHYWPLSSFKQRTPGHFELLSDMTSNNIPWLMLYRRDE